MKVYLVRYPSVLPFSLDSELNYEKPDIPKEYPAEFFDKEICPLDMILFYTAFADEKGSCFDCVFAYMQAEKITGGKVYAGEKLSFDKTRNGVGVLNFSRKRILTRYGSPREYWSLPEFSRCLNIRHNSKSLLPSFCTEGVQRFFKGGFDTICLSAVPSKDSGVYYENALLEWTSSMCEDIRGDATRSFNALKKGEVGVGKTGFVKYDYTPDSRRSFYCRLNHTVGKRCMRACESCPMYKIKGKRRVCEWSLPVYGALPYIPLTTADAFAYFDVLLEKGLVMDYRE